MKKLFLLGAMVCALTIITACHKDEPQDIPQEEQFSMQGTWFNPDMNCWFQQLLNEETRGYVWFELAWKQDDFYKTIEFTDDCQVGGQWQGCFKWNEKLYDPFFVSLGEPYTYYYRVNDSSTRITLHCPECNSQIQDVPFRVISPNEMMIDGELYIRITDNHTPMVTLPNRNWHYDWDSNGFYYTGAGAWMYDYNNPAYEMRGSQLYVYWGTNMNQAVRPCANYETLTKVPKGTFDCTSRGPIMFELRQIDYNGTQVAAFVQNSGGSWFDRVCEYAFAGCKELNTLKLGNQIIEDYAFYGCSLKDIFIMLPSLPDSVSETAFDDWQYEHTVLHVHTYPNSSPWNKFKHVCVDITDDMLSYFL